ncbi:hypothetical protein BLNAU_13312 [Blattamonas nauphoetae]|uniref:PUM-HD domain-containing protein n=1 Tax=Blattamonas nauphoetae TaxID=2049346 RepID=A0ABQ9XNJ1_9EUKA|nr:hypothetical protein BLNAU_13312 [Blattamonas nauphoetae]
MHQSVTSSSFMTFQPSFSLQSPQQSNDLTPKESSMSDVQHHWLEQSDSPSSLSQLTTTFLQDNENEPTFISFTADPLTSVSPFGSATPDKRHPPLVINSFGKPQQHFSPTVSNRRRNTEFADKGLGRRHRRTKSQNSETVEATSELLEPSHEFNTGPSSPQLVLTETVNQSIHSSTMSSQLTEIPIEHLQLSDQVPTVTLPVVDTQESSNVGISILLPTHHKNDTLLPASSTSPRSSLDSFPTVLNPSVNHTMSDISPPHIIIEPPHKTTIIPLHTTQSTENRSSVPYSFTPADISLPRLKTNSIPKFTPSNTSNSFRPAQSHNTIQTHPISVNYTPVRRGNAYSTVNSLHLSPNLPSSLQSSNNFTSPPYFTPSNEVKRNNDSKTGRKPIHQPSATHFPSLRTQQDVDRSDPFSSWVSVRGQFLQLLSTQQGCRFFQECLDSIKAQDDRGGQTRTNLMNISNIQAMNRNSLLRIALEMCLQEISGSFFRLCTDRFANYSIQTLLRHSPPSLLLTIVDYLPPHSIATLSFNSFGTHIVQTLISLSPSLDPIINIITRELYNRIFSLLTDTVGIHVVNCLFQSWPDSKTRFIIEDIISSPSAREARTKHISILSSAQDKGVRLSKDVKTQLYFFVVQRICHVVPEVHKPLIAFSLVPYIVLLSKDTASNYLVQNMMRLKWREIESPPYTARAFFSSFIPHIPELLVHRIGSNVADTFLVTCDQNTFSSLIQFLVSTPPQLISISTHSVSNPSVQKMCMSATGDDRMKLIQFFTQYQPTLSHNVLGESILQLFRIPGDNC